MRKKISIHAPIGALVLINLDICVVRVVGDLVGVKVVGGALHHSRLTAPPSPPTATPTPPILLQTESTFFGTHQIFFYEHFN